MFTRPAAPVATTQELTPLPLGSPPPEPRAARPSKPRLFDPRRLGTSGAFSADEIYRRLGHTAVVLGLTYSIVHMVGRTLGIYQSMPGYNAVLATLVWLGTVALSVAMYWATRRKVLAPEHMETAAIGFEILAAVAIDVFLVWLPQGGEIEALRISWVTVWVMYFVIVVPMPPHKQLIGALGAACSTPVLLGIGIWRGISDPSAAWIVQYVFPNFVVVVCSFVSAKVVYRMREEVQASRAMGSYKLVEPLGSGGMGEVWRGEHSRLARPAAIKLIRPEMVSPGGSTDAAKMFQRFEREAQLTSTLESAHTVTVYDFGISEDGSFYYVMELLRGMDLEQLVARFGPLPAERAVFLLRQACHSLAEAHSRGLMHRDIKPANLYVCRWGLDCDFIKVLDFGLARPVNPTEGDPRLTQFGVTAGTPAYMAPESLLAKPGIDARADIYSLGCVAYWLLTGRHVFPSANGFEAAMHHVQSKPVPPSEASELAVPAALDRAVLACLDKDPEKRPQSMHEVDRLLAAAVPQNWNSDMAGDWWKRHVPDFCDAVPPVATAKPASA